MFTPTYRYIGYITYTDAEGYTETEDFEFESIRDDAWATAESIMKKAYEPGGELSIRETWPV